jgi:Outer membrane protein beta-barrel domain
MRYLFDMSAIILCLLLSSDCFAFDGQRKGVNFGGGLGICPASRISGYGSADAGLSLDMFLGYSIDNQNTLLWSAKGAGSVYESDYVKEYAIINVIEGPNWYHYFRRKSPSLFSMVGFGFATYSSKSWSSERGMGVMVGLGYEFARHLSLNAFILLGRSNHGNSHFEAINLTLDAMAY